MTMRHRPDGVTPLWTQVNAAVPPPQDMQAEHHLPHRVRTTRDPGPEQISQREMNSEHRSSESCPKPHNWTSDHNRHRKSTADRSRGRGSPA